MTELTRFLIVLVLVFLVAVLAVTLYRYTHCTQVLGTTVCQ